MTRLIHPRTYFVLLRNQIKNCSKKFNPQERQLLRDIRDYLDQSARRSGEPPRIRTPLLVWVNADPDPIEVIWQHNGGYFLSRNRKRIDPLAITSWMRLPIIWAEGRYDSIANRTEAEKTRTLAGKAKGSEGQRESEYRQKEGQAGGESGTQATPAGVVDYGEVGG